MNLFTLDENGLAADMIFSCPVVFYITGPGVPYFSEQGEVDVVEYSCYILIKRKVKFSPE